MKALLVSDLHFEFHRDNGRSLVDSLPDADVLLCPGDLTNAAGIWDALLLLLEKWPHVVYTYGNHEFYGSNIPAVKKKVARLIKRLPRLGDNLGQLHVLDNSTCEIEGRRFVGTTLWFRKVMGGLKYDRMMNDFSQIGNSERIYEENDAAEEFLRETVTGDDIVLTHHMPAAESIHPKYEGSPLNRYFMTDMAWLIEQRQPKLWVHGHTHTSTQYQLGHTRVVCNPFGYAAYEENPEFDPNLIIDLTKLRPEDDGA